MNQPKTKHKLKHCIIGKNKDFLIQIISDASDKYGDKLLAFLDKYHLIGLKDATEEQLEAFILDDLPRLCNDSQTREK